MTIYDTREGVRLVLKQQSKGYWNGKDPILKERMFGLTGSEGNYVRIE